MDLAAYVAERRTALFRFAVVLTGDPVLADDLLADVLSDAFEHWGRVSAVENPHAYVRRMLVNAFAKSRRRRTRTAPWGDLTGILDPAPDQPLRMPNTSGRSSRSAGFRHDSELPLCCATTKGCRSPRSPKSSAPARTRYAATSRAACADSRCI